MLGLHTAGTSHRAGSHSTLSDCTYIDGGWKRQAGKLLLPAGDIMSVICIGSLSQIFGFTMIYD